MALTQNEKAALVAILKAELRDEIKQDMMRSDEQASTPHAGNAGPSGDPGETQNKTLSAIADALGKLHARMDEWEKNEKESDLKSEGLKGVEDAAGEDAGEIFSKEEPKPVAADRADSDDFYGELRSDKDYERQRRAAAMMAEIQAKYDKVFSLRNDSCPRALPGERGIDYRRRILGQLKRLSPTFKDVDLATVPDKLLAPIEQTIYNDAQTCLADPKNWVSPDGDLHEVVTTDATGRRISTFVSSVVSGYSLKPPE